MKRTDSLPLSRKLILAATAVSILTVFLLIVCMGGAVLLGVQGCVIKAHGVSKAKSFANAIEQAIQCIRGDVVGKIREGLAAQAEEKA